MNKLLLIPGVLVCVGFVWVAGAGWSTHSTGGAYSGSARSAGGNALLSLENVRDKLVEKWKSYNDERNAFSRVYRPEKYYGTPGILVDQTLPSPDGTFVGVFTVTYPKPESGNVKKAVVADSDNGSVAEFPLVVDRISGEAFVFAGEKWMEFKQWVVSGEM